MENSREVLSPINSRRSTLVSSSSSSSTSLQLIIIAISFFFFLVSTFSAASTIPDNHVAIFIFGDSLYDAGMTLYNGIEGAGADTLPYGETYFKKPAGRYSDGRVIPDFIAEHAKLPLLPPYLLPGLSNYTNGVNFASAGACILVETRPDTINLKMQVEYFDQMVVKLRKQMGEAETKKLLSKAVYLFSIGGNDYVSLMQANLNKPSLSSSYKKLYMSMILGNLTTHIRSIYSKGGRKFAFQNIGPIGCMPSIKSMYGFSGDCVKEPQLLAKMHNAAFVEVINKLQTRLSGLKYSVFDYYAQCANRFFYNKRYGFTESRNACCGSGTYNGQFTCSNKAENFTVCSTPSSYLWFDAAHHSEKGNQQFAQLFWNGASNVVAPYNFKTLVDMH